MLPPATLYSTWQQAPTGTKPAVYMIVIMITCQNNEPKSLLLLNLDGNLTTKEVTPLEMSELIDKQILKPWLPGTIPTTLFGKP